MTFDCPLKSEAVKHFISLCVIGGFGFGEPPLKNDQAVRQVCLWKPQRAVLGRFFFNGPISFLLK